MWGVTRVSLPTINEGTRLIYVSAMRTGGSARETSTPKELALFGYKVLGKLRRGDTVRLKEGKPITAYNSNRRISWPGEDDHGHMGAAETVH